MKKRSRKTLVRRLDTACAWKVKERDGWACQRCGTKYPQGSSGLQWAHVYSRSRHSMRWLLENGLALCTGCHFWQHGHPIEFSDWFREKYPKRAALLAMEKRRAPSTMRISDLQAKLLALENL